MPDPSLQKPSSLFFQIMIVDDEPVARHLLRSVLFGAGYTQVDEAGGPAEALKALENEEYHLVLLDKNMPDMDGLTLLQEIRRRWPQIEVIIITAYGSLETAIEAMDLGAFSYLVKPFSDITAVIQRVENALNRAASHHQISILLGRLEVVLEQFSNTCSAPNAESQNDRSLEAENRLRGIVMELRDLVAKQRRLPTASDQD